MGILPQNAEAFVVNTELGHWYAIVSSTRPDGTGTRIWWNVCSTEAGLRGNWKTCRGNLPPHPLRIGTDRELANALVRLVPHILRGMVQGMPDGYGNRRINQIWSVQQSLLRQPAKRGCKTK